MARRRRSLLHDEPPVPAGLLTAVSSLAGPLGAHADLDPLLDRVADARYVLLGEASHGTHEFYTWRAAISRRLIEERGFSFIAVEGDWPDCYRVNRYVKGYDGGSAREVLHAFSRWPTWMWANEEVVELVGWLRGFNDSLDRPGERKVGFYGLDVYSLWDSLHQVLGYLRVHDPAALPIARRALRCFEPFGEDVHAYARATRWVHVSCEDEVIALLAALRAAGPSAHDDPEARFEAEQNAVVIRNAERYYRTMVQGGPESWNLRDQHMTQTLERLMRRHGPGARGIVWAHNTHVGDARYTDMADAGMINIGQLVRQGHEGEGVVLVGFGSYRGSVIAGREWEAPMERMLVPPGRPGSWEEVLHRAGAEDRLLLLTEARASEDLLLERGHRAIGVVYNPERERFGNYVPTVLPLRYDAFVFLDETRALQPLHEVRPVAVGEPPETYPSGL